MKHLIKQVKGKGWKPDKREPKCEKRNT